MSRAPLCSVLPFPNPMTAHGSRRPARRPGRDSGLGGRDRRVGRLVGRERQKDAHRPTLARSQGLPRRQGGLSESSFRSRGSSWQVIDPSCEVGDTGGVVGSDPWAALHNGAILAARRVSLHHPFRMGRTGAGRADARARRHARGRHRARERPGSSRADGRRSARRRRRGAPRTRAGACANRPRRAA